MNRNIDPEKLQDMIRGILPSTERGYTRREKALRKRAFRRRVRMDVRNEDPVETKVDLRRDVYVLDLVRDRRTNDKLNHFMRWCESITEGMTTEEALSHVRSILPRSLIGDHAYTHWEFHCKDPYAYLRPPAPYPEMRRRQAQSRHDGLTFRLRRALRAEPDLHARLNALIKSRTPADVPRRLLLGSYDVEAFIDDINEIEYRAMLELIEEIEKSGLPAALKVYGPNSIDSISTRTFFAHSFGAFRMVWLNFST